MRRIRLSLRRYLRKRARVRLMDWEDVTFADELDTDEMNVIMTGQPADKV